MVLIPRNRLWWTIAALLLAALLGVTGGYLHWRYRVRVETEGRLQEDAIQGARPFLAFLDESGSLLEDLHQSKNASCSDEEIVWFRQFLFRAKTIRDVGRMRDGRLECSALYGRHLSPGVSFQPTVTRQDGMRIYSHVAPYHLPQGAVFLAQQGDFFVVEAPSLRTHMPNHNYESTLVDAVSQRRMRPSGLPLLHPGAVIDRNTHGSLGGILYATVCAPGTYVCTTAYEPFSEALRANRGGLVLYSALGGVSCALVALILLVLESHSRSMEQQLRRAIRNNELRLLYQPIVDLATGRIVEAEALLRWTDEDGYIVGPDVFVRIAEERGFMAELTAWVVRRALSDFAPALRERGGFRLNINVAASDLADERFLPMLERCLTETGVAPASLAIEVTESSTASAPAARETIRQLRQRGHSIQIDDFGTGYSSLAYLKDLHVDAIKIDRVFTHAIGTEAVTVAILPQILAMAHALDLLVIVEGIETVEQAGYFAGQERTILGQGWLFGHPISIKEFRKLLEASNTPKEIAKILD